MGDRGRGIVLARFQYLSVLALAAAGLYYLAELVEEYTVTAKKVITWLVVGSVALYVVFIFTERFSWTMVLCGLGAQALHAAILKNFPYVKFMSPSFLGAIVLLLLNHYLAFIYFQQQYHPFAEVIGLALFCLRICLIMAFFAFSTGNGVLYPRPMAGSLCVVCFAVG